MTGVAEHVFSLSGPQYEVYDSPARFRVLIAGRRFGKTFLAGVALLESALTYPDSENWYTAPTYKNAKRVAWRRFKRIIPREYIRARNESGLFIDLRNGSRITLVGREDPDNLRGDGLRRIVNDEFAVQEQGDKGKTTWEEVLRPMLSDTLGDALFITTPKGYNWGHELWLRGQDTPDPDWASWQFTSLQGGRIPASEIEAARRDLDPRSFRQEYEASFEALGNRVYDYFERAVHLDPIITDPGTEILVGQDFNVNPMASVIAVQVGDECHVLDSLELPVSNTDEVAAEIRTRYPDRRVIFCPDPSGRARKTSAPVGQTDFTILQRAGFQVDAPHAAPLIHDRVNNVQANLRSADGRVRLRIHPRATALIRGLEGLTYKEGTSQPDKGPLSHVTEALGYLLWARFNRLINRTVRTGDFSI